MAGAVGPDGGKFTGMSGGDKNCCQTLLIS